MMTIYSMKEWAFNSPDGHRAGPFIAAFDGGYPRDSSLISIKSYTFHAQSTVTSSTNSLVGQDKPLSALALRYQFT